MNLVRLYQTLNSKEMHEILKVDGIEDCTVASLRVSLEASVMMLEKEDPVALELFFLIGLMPGGVNEDQLKKMNIRQWEEKSKKLREFSLVSEVLKEIAVSEEEDE